MQYRAILVDDEHWLLEGLLRTFPWESYGFTVVGKFSDAEDALRFMESNAVDLVLTDIRMPEFSGLDFLEASRQRGDTAEFVMISGYSDFEYARQALRSNAFEYCLKPVKRGDAEELLARLRIKLDAKNADQHR
ncbi:MAG TPA: response regulator, partial [Clostridia bacterium]|nr:response regulator [Clostridia bacterium]